MKRLALVALALATSISVAGCSQSADVAALESENAELKERIAALESAAAATPEPTVEVATATPAPTEEPTPEPTAAPSAEEQLIMDADGLKVYLKGYDPEGAYSGPTIDLRIENDTDRDYIFQTRDFSVGNVLTDVAFSESVAAGKVANCDITIQQNSLDENGITAVDEVNFSIFYGPRDAMVTEGKQTDPIALTFT